MHHECARTVLAPPHVLLIFSLWTAHSTDSVSEIAAIMPDAVSLSSRPQLSEALVQLLGPARVRDARTEHAAIQLVYTSVHGLVPASQIAALNPIDWTF